MQNTQKMNASNKKKQLNNKNTKSRTAPRKQEVKTSYAPVSVGNIIHRGKPKFRNEGDNVVVSHSEFVTDIVGSSSAFAVANALTINPGLISSFPWLSALAARYESYRFRRLRFRYETESATSQTGYVTLVPDYNPSDLPPSSKTLAFQHADAVKVSPWENGALNCATTDLSKRKSYFNRYDSIQANQNIDLFDTCNLFVCVGGNSGAVTLGELWIDYEVCLSTPQIEVTSSHESAKVIGSTAMTTALPYGTAAVSTFGNNNLFTYDGATGNFTWLVPYQGLLASWLAGTGLSAQTPTVSSDATMTDLVDIANAAGTYDVASYIGSFVAGSTMSFTANGTTVTSANLFIGDYKFSLGT